MSGAQSWSVKGIDPKVREAAREAAARQGMSLGEYLNQALPSQAARRRRRAPPHAAAAARARAALSACTRDAEDEDDWRSAARAAHADPARLAQRIESIERRTQLAVTGLDRAVSTIDRSVLGLAARVEDAEAVVRRSRRTHRRGARTIPHRRRDAERAAASAPNTKPTESRSALDGAASELEQRQGAARTSGQRRRGSGAPRRGGGLVPDHAKWKTATPPSRKRWPRRAPSPKKPRARPSEASADAVSELRRLQEEMSERLVETETSTRRAIETRHLRSAQRDQRARRATRAKRCWKKWCGSKARSPGASARSIS